MANIKSKMISFTEKNRIVYEYLQTKHNASAYICDLIRQDMNKDNLEERIRNIVNEVIQSNKKDDYVINSIKDMLDI